MSDRPPDETPGALKGCASIAYGFWMLLAGVPATFYFASQEGGRWVALLTAFMTSLGGLLILEPRWAGERPADEQPSLVEVSPGMLARSGPPTSRRGRFPVWLHLLLLFPLSVAGMFGGAIVGASTYGMIVMGVARVVGERAARGGGGIDAFLMRCFTLIAAPLCFFGGGILGLGHAQRLLLRYVPTRCRECGGDCYCRLGRPITYTCRMCGHVHRTIWNVK